MLKAGDQVRYCLFGSAFDSVTFSREGVILGRCRLKYEEENVYVILDSKTLLTRKGSGLKFVRRGSCPLKEELLTHKNENIRKIAHFLNEESGIFEIDDIESLKIISTGK